MNEGAKILGTFLIVDVLSGFWVLKVISCVGAALTPT
jgi:hypothetical protein